MKGNKAPTVRCACAGGKRDEKLILPINDSVSVTLSSDQMHAKTRYYNYYLGDLYYY